MEQGREGGEGDISDLTPEPPGDRPSATSEGTVNATDRSS